MINLSSFKKKSYQERKTFLENFFSHFSAGGNKVILHYKTTFHAISKPSDKFLNYIFSRIEAILEQSKHYSRNEFLKRRTPHTTSIGLENQDSERKDAENLLLEI